MTYTDIVDGYQICDVVYIGQPPRGTPPTYDIVKHVVCDPHEVISLETGKRQISTHYCFSVARVIWDAHEGWWKVHSVGTRLLDHYPPPAAVQMILDFCEEKAKELRHETD